MNERMRELIHGEADRTNSPEESAELQGLLTSDAQAAEQLRELKELNRIFKEGPIVEPPASLKDGIMTAIGRKSHTVVTPIHGSAASRRISLSQVSMFAVGLAAGLACFLMFGGGDRPTFLNESDLYGTITAVKDGPNFRKVDEQTLELDGVSAVVVTHAASGIGSATLVIDSPTDIGVILSFEPKQMSFMGFGQSLNAADQVSIKAGAITFQHVGSGRYTFLFGPSELPTGKLSVGILSNGVSSIKSVQMEIAE